MHVLLRGRRREEVKTLRYGVAGGLYVGGTYIGMEEGREFTESCQPTRTKRLTQRYLMEMIRPGRGYEISMNVK